MESKVIIVSGWSNPGGSTVAQINMCNLFNENRIPCEFYGPHDWHTDKCNGYNFNEKSFDVGREDILIVHYYDLPFKERPDIKKLIYSCRETNIKPLTAIKNLHIFDCVHFVSNSQMQWQFKNSNVLGNAFFPSQSTVIIPNVLDDLKPTPSFSKSNVAGVIGSIDSHKQTHLSIKTALEAYPKVNVYGMITDIEYFNKEVLPLLSDRVIYKGHYDDKQKMYDEIVAVFHSSKRETFNLVKAECQLAGVKYFGLQSANTDADYSLTREQILAKWKEVFEI